MIGRETRVLLRHYLEQGMSKAAIARQVGINPRTVYRWIAAGQLDRELDDGAVRYGPRRSRPSKLDPVQRGPEASGLGETGRADPQESRAGQAGTGSRLCLTH